MRGRAYVRAVRENAIKRKKRITQSYPLDLEYYADDGRFSKGKIHCGCGLCKPTKRFGVHAWPLHKLDVAMMEDIKEYEKGA